MNSTELVGGPFELIEMKDGATIGFKPVIFKDVMKCMCNGCKLMFPIVAVVRDFSILTEAQALVITKGCQDHNSLVLKNLEDC